VISKRPMAPATTINSVDSQPVPSVLTRTALLTIPQRVVMFGSTAAAGFLGILPHVMHHAGPLAGAALLAGTGGALLFGAIGLVASIPLMLRVHRRCGNWRVPAALLVLFSVIFSISTFVFGPAISGGGKEDANRSTTDQAAPDAPRQEGHDAHHK